MQYSLIYLSYISLFFLGLADNIRGPIYPELLKEFGLSSSMGSLFFSTASLFIIFGGVFGGRFLQKIGRLKLLRIGVFMLAISVLLIYLSTQFTFIILWAVFLGFSLGLLGVAQNVLVLENSYPNELQKWQSGLHSFYGLSSLLAPLLVVTVHKLGQTWREPFLYVSILGLFIFINTLFVKDENKNFLIEKQDQKVKDKYSKTEIYFFASIIAIYVASEIIVSTRISQFCQSGLGLDFQKSMLINILFFVGLFLGRLLFVFWQPQRSLKLQMKLSLLISSISVLFALFVRAEFFLLTGIAMAPFYPLIMTGAGKMFPNSLSQIAGLGIGLSGVTVVIMHSVVGYLTDQFGVAFAMLVGPFSSILALIMILIYKRVFQREIP